MFIGIRYVCLGYVETLLELLSVYADGNQDQYSGVIIIYII